MNIKEILAAHYRVLPSKISDEKVIRILVELRRGIKNHTLCEFDKKVAKDLNNLGLLYSAGSKANCPK